VVSRYELLVDGERVQRVSTVEELRTWLRSYRADNADDDPDATHVQVREMTRFAWLTGGRLLDRDEFLDHEDSG
jgi:hypothetical protein